MIYLDYNATTPVAAGVLQRMRPYFDASFGNSSSGSHSFGWAAQAAVEAAAESLATLLRCEPDSLVFTSGATESLNMAIKGIADLNPGGRIITSATEHKAVLDSCEAVRALGVTVEVLGTDSRGVVDVGELERRLRDGASLVAIMWANNETGTIAPIEEISRVARLYDVPFLTDATQAVGKIPVSVEHVDMLACSAHKLYGPKGVGALFVRRGRKGIRLPRFIDGGGQQRNMRGGTLNVPGIVGLGAAAELAANLTDEASRASALRDRLEHRLVAQCDGAAVNGDVANRLPQTTSITFPGVEAAKLMAELRTLAVSNASACQSDSGKPSHVLTAMGLSAADARATIRFSLGRPTTDSEVDEAIALVSDAWSRLAGRQQPSLAAESTR